MSGMIFFFNKKHRISFFVCPPMSEFYMVTLRTVCVGASIIMCVPTLKCQVEEVGNIFVHVLVFDGVHVWS